MLATDQTVSSNQLRDILGLEDDEVLEGVEDKDTIPTCSGWWVKKLYQDAWEFHVNESFATDDEVAACL